MSKAKCKNCGDVVESKTRHDWQSCSCFHETEVLVARLSERLLAAKSEHAMHCILQEELGRGFFIDGGSEYCRCGGNLEDMEWVK
jgi:hypothetical protein